MSITVGGQGIRNKLLSGTALTALLTVQTEGTVGIYRTSAPANAIVPYVIFAHMAGGDTNRTQHREFDQRWLVKGVSNDQETSELISVQLEALLHNTKPTLADPWGALDCEHTAPVEYEEIVQNENFWHNGGIYRLRAVSTTLYGS